MAEQITIIVDQPRTVTNLTRQNVTTVTKQTVSATQLVRQSVTTPDEGAVEVTERVAQTTTIAVAGLQGPKGDRGLPGLGSNTAVLEQATPAAVWHLVHGLGQFPSVVTVDSAGSTVIGAVTYVSSDEITVTFSSAMAGTAYLN